MRSVQREIRLPADAKEANDFRFKIDKLKSENEDLKNEIDKITKTGDQAVKLARWDEKKAFENKLKTLQEKNDQFQSENNRLETENERVKKLLIKLQNSKYRSPRLETTQDSDRISEAKLSEANREIVRLKRENDNLRNQSHVAPKVKGSTSPRTTAEMKNTIIQLQKENSKLRTQGGSSPNKSMSHQLANQKSQIQRLKIELANQKQNTDSVDSFVLNEKEIELRTMQKKYEKSMERVVKLEDHIMALGWDLIDIPRWVFLENLSRYRSNHIINLRWIFFK